MVRLNTKLISRQEANHNRNQQKLATNDHNKTIKSNYTQTSKYVTKHKLERRDNENRII